MVRETWADNEAPEAGCEKIESKLRVAEAEDKVTRLDKGKFYSVFDGAMLSECLSKALAVLL